MAITPLFLLLLAATLALVLSFHCALCEAVLQRLRPGEVEERVGRDARAARAARRWGEDPDQPVGAMRLVRRLALGFGALGVGWSWEGAVGPGRVWLLVLAFPVVVLLVGDVVPQAVGAAFAARLALPVIHATHLLLWLVHPLTAATTGLRRRLAGAGARPPLSTLPDARLAAALGSSAEAVGPRMVQVIKGAASLRELTVYDVMVPRGGVAFLSATRSLEENLAIIRTTGHSRFPYTPSADLDDVTGIVLAKELLFQARDGRDAVEWEPLVSPLLVVPDSKPLDQVLKMFQDQRKHLAVVVDEYGGIQGVLTLEDVLEEIVGEIEDETDRVEQAIVKRPDGSLVCRGWAETRKVFKVLGLDEKSESVTVGGFVADLLGRVPRVDDVATWNGHCFRVVKASARRAERVEVTALPDDGSTSGPAPSSVAS